MSHTLHSLLVTLTAVSIVVPGCSSDTEPVTAWKVKEELRIGSQMGGGPDMFGDIGDLSIGPNSQVYVYDNDAHEIRVFDRNGRFVRRFGGSGAGPGEFGSVWAMAWDPDDNLWIVDNRNQRYSIFDEVGELIRDFRSPVVTRDAQIFGLDQSGYLYDQSAFVDSTNTYRRLLVQMNQDGEKVGEIVLPECTVQALERGAMRFPIPFSRRLIMRFDPSGYIWYGINDRYEIFRLALDGERTLIVRGNIEELPLTSSDRDSVSTYIDDLKTRFRMASVPGSIMPQAKPIYNGIYLDQRTGNIWVKLINYENDVTIFDVYQTDGTAIGSVLCEMPFLSDPKPVIIDEELWFVTEDELGAQYVVRGVLVPSRTQM